MNSFSATGRISSRDLILRETNEGKQVLNFSIAMNRVGSDSADFVSCTAFGKMAENIVKYSGTGLRVALRGRLCSDEYEKEGMKIYTNYILVSEIEFIDFKKESEE